MLTSSDEVSVCVKSYDVKRSKWEKLLNIKTDSKLNFDNYID